MYHKITIIGKVGTQPIKVQTKDRTFVNFELISTRPPNKDGVKDTTWFTVSTLGRVAQACIENLKPGSLILLEGRLQATADGYPRTFTRKDGTTGAAFNILASMVTFLPSCHDDVHL